MKGHSWFQTWGSTATWAGGSTVTVTTGGSVTGGAYPPAHTRWWVDGQEIFLPRPQVQHCQSWTCDQCGRLWTQVNDRDPPVLPPVPLCFGLHKQHFCSAACLEAAQAEEQCHRALLELGRLPDLLPAARRADKKG